MFLYLRLGKDEVLNMIDINSSLYVECRKNKKDNYNYVHDSKKYKISLDGKIYLKIPTQNMQYFVELDDFINGLDYAIIENKRIFYIGDVIKKIEKTMSYHIAYGHINNTEYNIVSADHCQDGTDKDIRRLYVCV